jgi:hypothetical protein
MDRMQNQSVPTHQERVTGRERKKSALVAGCSQLLAVLALCAGACGAPSMYEGQTFNLTGTGGIGGPPNFVRVGLDTHIVENDPTNYWDRDRISVRGDGSGSAPVMVGLVMWDLVAAPPCNVSFATITFRVASTSAQSFKLYPANRFWTSNVANWTLAGSGVPWQVPGAMGATDRGPAFQEFTPSQAGRQQLTLNATGLALVQSWINQPGIDNGIIVGHETHADGFSFYSFEAASVTDRPTLMYTCQ